MTNQPKKTGTQRSKAPTGTSPEISVGMGNSEGREGCPWEQPTSCFGRPHWHRFRDIERLVARPSIQPGLFRTELRTLKRKVRIAKSGQRPKKSGSSARKSGVFPQTFPSLLEERQSDILMAIGRGKTSCHRRADISIMTWPGIVSGGGPGPSRATTTAAP